MIPVPKTGTAETGKSRPRWELADVFRLYGEAYRSSHLLPSSHRAVMRAIEVCRTAELGGHVEQCNRCGHARQAYNSCRNRHCPKCQAFKVARWLQARKIEQLPAPSFHLVFTVPHELNPLALCNKKAVYDILFQSASGTLQTFASDPKRGLGGKIGITAILHTWDQTLGDHIHLHCAVPAGALSLDGQRWIPARENFLFPVKALSKVFRGKFLAALRSSFDQNKLSFPGKTAAWQTAEGFRSLLHTLYQKPWLVYSKPAFGGPQAVLDYFGRYTHRIALSNDRLLSIDNGQVSFSYRDRRDCNKRKVMTLSAQEFIRRFLLHVLPSSFVRIRHFGFFANRSKKNDLPRCRELLGLPATIPQVPHITTSDLSKQLTGKDLIQCPLCKDGQMRVVSEIPKVSFWNSS